MMEERTYAVAELSADIERLLSAAFPAELWVRGEIANLSRSASGHAYFELAEPGGPSVARLSVVLFDGDRQVVNSVLTRAGGVRMTDGTEIRVRARLAWWRPGGRLQLRMLGIDPAYTLGRLAEDRERLLRALAAEGLLDRNGKLPLAAVPQRVGLVTSVGSAAHADFCHQLEASGLTWHVTVVDTRVQGAGAVRGLVRSLRAVAGAGVDVVALVRGGGARTDLAVFDHEVLARAIAELRVPVVTGIGHETDRSVADEVAHSAAKTPTACASVLIDRVRAYLGEVEGTWTAVAEGAARRLAGHDLRVVGRARAVSQLTRSSLGAERIRLGGHADRLGRTATRSADRAVARLAHGGGRLAGSSRSHLRGQSTLVDQAARRVAHRAPHALAEATARLTGAEVRVTALDPARSLARGWSITRTQQGTVVRQPGDVSEGDVLVTLLAGGELRSRVLDPEDDRRGR
ncbi:exodeoxyribonuclease VII large subunit [soil metagenome]